MANPSSVFTWNVNKRAELLDEQADRVLLDNPQVVCLQEISPKALPRWTAHLETDWLHGGSQRDAAVDAERTPCPSSHRNSASTHTR